MNKLDILQAAVSDIWAINIDALEKTLLFAIAYIRSGGLFAVSDQEVEENRIRFGTKLLDPQGNLTLAADSPKANPGSIAIIPIKHALTPEGYYGIPGTDSIRQSVLAADADDNIVAILFEVESPGGSVRGTERTSQAIADVSKPTIAHVKGGYSAAYWLISSCSYIMLDGETCGVGSIGTMYGGFHMMGILEKLGAKEVMAVAKDSPDKNKSGRDLLSGDDAAFQEEVLLPLNAQFKGAVKNHRGDKLQLKVHSEDRVEPVSGKIYFGSTAVSWGLADGLGTMSDAITTAYQMAGYEPAATQAHFSISNTDMLFTQKFKAVLALAAKQKTGEEPTAEEIEAANAELRAAGIAGLELAPTGNTDASEEHQALVDSYTAAVQVLEPEATAEEALEYDLAEAVTTLTQELATAQEQVGTLKQKTVRPRPAKKTTATSEIETEEKEQEFYSEADAEVDAMLNSINGN